MKQSVVSIIIGLLIGGALSYLFFSPLSKTQVSEPKAIQHEDRMDHKSMSMSEMTGSLENKSGDEFDKLFLSEMIVHHQGAIDMAMYAKNNAKHDEIKKLADDIIAAQATEIQMMKQWQEEWGY